LFFSPWMGKIKEGVFCMPKKALRAVLLVFFGVLGMSFSAAQDNFSGEGEMSRGSIPEALLRPQRGEAPRYPVDTVIGPLGRGESSAEAYLFARKVSAALTAGNRNDPSLSGMNSVSLEAFVSELSGISPQAYRLGGGREEPDGAVSFMVRFLGRDMGITGELYIRFREFEPEPAKPVEIAEAAEPPETAETAEAIEAAEAAEVIEPAETAETAETIKAADTVEAAEPAEAIEPVRAAGTARTVPAVWVFEDLILEEARERAVEEDNQRFDFPPYERFF
jgi:hypothetical protein